MKKLIFILIVIGVLAAGYLLPMPLIASNLRSQYATGDTIEIDLAVWNVSPLGRSVSDESTSAVLKIDGDPVATIATNASPTIPAFGRTAETVSFKTSKEPSDVIAFEQSTSQIRLPPGKHTVSVSWLGSSSWPHRLTIVQL